MINDVVPKEGAAHGLRPSIGVGRTYGLFDDAELFEFRTESVVIGVPRKAADEKLRHDDLDYRGLKQTGRCLGRSS